ncbi:hypothetical protein Hbl1158_15380 (plasmid) [Halobaculum sp. CBA1158]|uniref:hypothetical protein n=1 Tax=Halobaculum sp. CBA1158 TaxID=2904243 RepID=UPI001F2E3D5D|nr:hypothetical protein [Halobaculum sp. CBA1158]UIP01517.1 hypothetical protein Hbl1158_15380 [Halobaculum sp. CBA1158]
MTVPFVNEDWRELPPNPDPIDDLGYRLLDLDFIPTSTSGGEEVIVLPTDEDMLREDAFMVVGRDDVVSLDDRV